MSYLSKSPWVIHYDASSCNGCDIEVLAALMPGYDVERFGIINTGNPKHADIFLITGSVNEQNKEVVQTIYSQMPDPKVVVAIGVCAASGGIFAQCYNVMGGVNKIIPVDVYVPGCAVKPESIIDGVVKALGILEEKRARMKKTAGSVAGVAIMPAVAADVREIVELQRIAYRSEAELYDDYNMAPLRQTCDELADDFTKYVFLKAVVDNKIIGSVRAYQDSAGVCHITRLVVYPHYRGKGLGSRLMREIEKAFSAASAYELFTRHRSRRNIYLCEKLGYRVYKSEKRSAGIEHVHFEKKQAGKT